MPEEQVHVCDEFRYRVELKLVYRKEIMASWNWNLIVMFEDNIELCFIVKFCPFCGKKLGE